MSQTYDVIAVGNAIVDILFQAPDSFLTQHAITRGAMTLIEADRALELTDLAQGATVQAGGSAANSMNGVASFGGKAAFIGKVADDAMGEEFTTAFRDAGVAFKTAPLHAPPPTARCLIVVSPDGQRSMNTYLGASTLIDADDIDRDMIAASGITFLEGYLFDREAAKAAFVRAAEYAKAADRKVAITLSDTFCVERHRESFRHLVANHIDILFANEHEIVSLYQTDTVESALQAARQDCPIVAVTRSDKGSIVAAGEDTHIVTAAAVDRVVDTTGAGDLYAAGFLFGLARGMDLGSCGRLGSIAAGEVIRNMGPRPQRNLKALAHEAGIIW
jgi:sugar/nucleoside kinase (ribokinase family)